MKRKLLIILIIICLFSFFGSKNVTVFAEQNIEQEIENEVNNQLGNLDISEIEDIVLNLTEDQKGIFGNETFWEKINKLLAGDMSTDEGVFKGVINLFFDSLLNLIPMLALIIAIAILFSMVSQTRSGFKSNSIKDIIHFVCYGSIIMIVLSCTVSVIGNVTSSIELLKKQMDAIFPVLLTLLTAIGGTASVAVYQPAFAILTGGVMTLFSKILLPIFICCLVFSVLSNLTSNIKFDKFVSFFSASFKWLIGICFTVFFGFVAIRGITAGSFDGVSIRTAKYAIKSSIPLIGGYMSDGFNLIMASSVLIKNAIGAGGFLLLIASLVFPVIELVLLMFGLKLTSAILEPLTDSRISNFISSVAKCISLLIALVVAVAFMYILLIGLVMCSANIY